VYSPKQGCDNDIEEPKKKKKKGKMRGTPHAINPYFLSISPLIFILVSGKHGEITGLAGVMGTCGVSECGMCRR
jgi:hypothetical protein